MAKLLDPSKDKREAFLRMAQDGQTHRAVLDLDNLSLGSSWQIEVPHEHVARIQLPRIHDRAQPTARHPDQSAVETEMRDRSRATNG